MPLWERAVAFLRCPAHLFSKPRAQGVSRVQIQDGFTPCAILDLFLRTRSAEKFYWCVEYLKVLASTWSIWPNTSPGRTRSCSWMERATEFWVFCPCWHKPVTSVSAWSQAGSEHSCVIWNKYLASERRRLHLLLMKLYINEKFSFYYAFFLSEYSFIPV